ncbi:MAG: hypothetical protein PHY54_13470 [Methylococcales bacterium]|nr:hypothetical protein [Methylococcales bacterium]
MNELLWFFCGVLLAGLTDWLLRLRHQSEERRNRIDAEKILKQHGLKPELYLATIGVEDTELRSALDTFAFSGYIITNDKGEVMGRLIGELAQRAGSQKVSYLRLVVSNGRVIK